MVFLIIIFILTWEEFTTENLTRASFHYQGIILLILTPLQTGFMHYILRILSSLEFGFPFSFQS